MHLVHALPEARSTDVGRWAASGGGGGGGGDDEDDLSMDDHDEL